MSFHPKSLFWRGRGPCLGRGAPPAAPRPVLVPGARLYGDSAWLGKGQHHAGFGKSPGPVTSTGWNKPEKGAGEAGCNVTSANTTNRQCCRSTDFGLPDLWASRGFGAGPNQVSPADTEPRACLSRLWGSARGRRGLFGARMLLWPSMAKRTAGCTQQMFQSKPWLKHRDKTPSVFTTTTAGGDNLTPALSGFPVLLYEGQWLRSGGSGALPQACGEACQQPVQGLGPRHRDAQHGLVAGLLGAAVARRRSVGDEGQPEDAQATVPGDDDFWDSAHAYGSGGEDGDESEGSGRAPK